MGLESIAAMSLIGGFASSAVGAMVTDAQNSKNFNQQKQLMKYQDDLNAKRWNEQFNQVNEYNSPTAQLGRLEQAGINPLFNSDFSGSSSASIGSNTSLGGFNPRVPDVGFADSIKQLADSLFNKEYLKLEERKVKATEERTGSDIKNQTDMTASQIAVNLQEIDNMRSQKDKTEKDIQKIDTDIVAVQEAIKQNWTRISQDNEQILQGWTKLGIDDYRSKWEQEVALANNQLGWYDAKTRRQNLELGQNQLDFAKSKFRMEYDFGVKKWSADLRKDKIDSFMSVLDKSSSNFLGWKTTSPKRLADISAMMTGFVNSMDSMSQESFLIVAPKVVDVMENCSQLNRWSFPFKNFKLPGDVFEPKDVSDGY